MKSCIAEYKCVVKEDFRGEMKREVFYHPAVRNTQ